MSADEKTIHDLAHENAQKDPNFAAASPQQKMDILQYHLHLLVKEREEQEND